MSYDNLMQYAADVEQAAVRAEWERVNKMPSKGSAVSYEEVQSMYQGRVQPLFEPFSQLPNPASYDGMINDLYNSMGKLSHGAHLTDPITGKNIQANRDMQAIQTAADSLTDWTGEAADKFKANFLDQLPPVATNQFLVLGVMKGAVEADKALWESARKDIENIANDTVKALDSLGGCTKSEFEFSLSVVSAVVAGLSIPLTAGASAVIAGVGAAASAVGATAKGVKAIKESAASPDQVLDAMKRAIDELTKQIRDKQGQITKTLNEYAGAVDMQKNQEPSPFVSPRPKLAGMEGATLTSSKGLGHYV